jgi:hypothetical protein
MSRGRQAKHETGGDTEMNELEIKMKYVFNHLNSFKRNRALAEIRKEEGKQEQSQFHELMSFKDIDKLELQLRALQKEIRETEDKE